MGSNNTEKLTQALAFLKQYCENNGVEFYSRIPSIPTSSQVFIVGTDAGSYGSIGVANAKVRCFYIDQKKYKWAELEGFREDQIYSLFEDELLKEASLEEFASLLIKCA